MFIFASIYQLDIFQPIILYVVYMPDVVAFFVVGEDVPTEMVHDTPLGMFVLHTYHLRIAIVFSIVHDVAKYTAKSMNHVCRLYLTLMNYL